jgi:hypothetical protein
MSETRHIERIYNTRADLRTNLDNKQIAILSDQQKEFVWKDTDGNMVTAAVQHVWNGATLTYLDSYFKTVYGTTSLVAGTLGAANAAMVGIKCNANHYGAYFEQNSGTKAWEIGVNGAGDLGFYNDGAIAVTFDDAVPGQIRIGATATSSTVRGFYYGLADQTWVNGFYGNVFSVTKTGGTTAYDDFVRINYNYFAYNDADGVIGEIKIGYDYFQLVAGTVGEAGANAQSVFVSDIFADIDGGTITGSIYTAYIRADIEPAATISGSVHGVYSYVAPDCDITGNVVGIYNYVDQVGGAGAKTITGTTYGIFSRVDMDGTTTGTVHNLYLDNDSNVDYALYSDGTAPAYFGGNVGIAGAMANNAKLDINFAVCPNYIKYMECRSSNVAHGITGFLSTDACFGIDIKNQNYGGATLIGASDNASYAVPLTLMGLQSTHTACDDTINCVQIVGGLKSGTGITTVGNGRLLSVLNYTTEMFYVSRGGNAWISANCSALSFTDRTPYYEGDAISEIMQIKGKDGEIDHDTLPAFARKEHVTEDRDIVPGRDLGAMISMLTVAVQQLKAEIDELKK